MIELKRSTVSVGVGVRQNLSNQERHFSRSFFTTVQLVMTGNDSQRLRYGVIGTPEQHWLRWKEAHASGDGEDPEGRRRRGGSVRPVRLGGGPGCELRTEYRSELLARHGRLECVAAFPTVPSLSERAVKDGVGQLYRACCNRGELILTEGRVSDIRVLLEEAWERFGRPSRVVTDRWREAELRDALDVSGVPACKLEVRGMGYKDGAEDLRVSRRACETGKVTPVPSLLLLAALAEARAITDLAGNSKLAKGAEGGRWMRAKDHVLGAATLGVATGRGDG